MNLKLSKLKSLTSIAYPQLLKLCLSLFLVCFSVELNAQSEEELKKQAEQLFEDEEYVKAYKLYSQLVSNHAQDPLYNYRLGVCMIYAEPDKKKSFSYLNKAYNNRAELPKDVTFFVGKAYHINYLFDEAIRYYNEFKQEAPGGMQKKLQVDREIRACGNGKRLLSTITDLEVTSKKQLNEADYFRSYDMNKVGGKLLVKTDNFKTNVDKKKKDKGVLYSTKTGDRVYFGSYGENSMNGKDIYYRERVAGGADFGKPVLVEGINTEFDEDYPFMHPDGNTLYFASKGHNSMGGYDIFVSTFNESTQSWTTPKNLEFPINSPDDDYLYVTDSSGKFAFFSTGRYSPPGKIDVLKIKTERRPIDFIMMRGSVAKESAKQSVRSKITVKNIGTGAVLGTWEADADGKYMMQLPNGAKLLYTVETPELKTQSQGISLPLAQVGKPFKQTVTYEDGILKIVNDFEEAPSDDSYLQYLKLIEEKSKLDPNEGKTLPQVAGNDADSLLAANTNTQAANTTNPTANGNNTDPKNNTGNTTDPKNNTGNNNSGVSNKELVDIAKKDAADSKKEAEVLNQDAWDAKDLGNAQKIEAENKMKAADEAMTKAEAITDEAVKKEEIAKAIDQKKEAEDQLAAANKIIELSKTLEKDAANKAKIAQLNDEYAKEMEKASNPKNNTAATAQKLEDIKKQIAGLSDQKSGSEDIYNKIKNDVSEKEKELAIATEKINTLNSDNANALGEIAKTENELAAAKKKKKIEIQTKLDQQKQDQQKIEGDLTQAKEDEKRITNELNAMKTEMAMIDKIKTENFAKVENNINSVNTNTGSTAGDSRPGSQQLEEKYTNKINVTDANNKENIASANTNLIAYNKDIDAQIAKDKAALAKTKDPNQKKALTADIKNLEAVKKQNQQSIVNNNNRINDINKQLLATNTTPNTNQNLKEIDPNNPAKAEDALRSIKESLTQADNALFNFNTYNNTAGQDIKVKADSQINDAYALQNKLKETITKAEENIKNSSTSMQKNSDDPEAILKQADDLSLKASTARNDANGKTGTEKENLIKEAEGYEKQAEEKQIQASELSSKITQGKYEVNKENLQTLLDAKKSDEGTTSQAKALMDEADQALKQAKAIREEANAIYNNAAKIGNLGNAEEKELIALNKQNQALDLLKKDNPDVAMKPYKDLNTVNIVNDAVVKEEIAKVNAELKQVVAAKTGAYQTLSEANTEEIKSANAVTASKTNINNTPALKSQQVAITKNLADISTLKAKAAQTTNETEKLVTLAEIVKKQNETILAINKLNSDADMMGAAIATNTKTVNDGGNNGGNNAVATNTKTTNEGNAGGNNAVATNTKTNDGGNNATQTPTVASKNNFTTEQANTAFSVDLSFENHKDTAIGQINNFFKNNDFELRNTQANNSKNSALDALKGIESETKAVDEAIAKANQDNASSEGAMNNVDIKNKINSLLDAADSFESEARTVRNDANAKTGDEQTTLLNQAKDLEDKSFGKKVEAAMLTMQYNEANFNANKNAINDMLATVSTSNPDLASSVKAKLEEIETKRKQAKDIREEANGLSNNAAKLGAMENADEAEAGILLKQQEIINELKGAVPDYVVKEPTYTNLGGTKDIPAELKQKQSDLYAREIAELTNLTNAYSLEYETNKNSIPKNLNGDQNKIRNNVINLNAESKDLLIRSSKTNDAAERLKLLSLAAKTGLVAATQLNILINKQPTAGLAAVDNKVKNNTATAVVTNTKTTNGGNNAVATNTKTTNEGNNAVTTNTKTTNSGNNDNNGVAGTKIITQVEGMEVVKGNAYSEANPIPIDAKPPDGLVFRVQIGAFKTRPANNSFRGIKPVNGETGGNGYTRYTAGNFTKMELATGVKNDFQKNGYPDAFVVVYFNGKRITMAEALAILEREGKTVGPAITSVGINKNVNPTFNNNPTVNPTATETPVTVVKELEKTKNLLYTVQIGVYSRLISKARLSNLSPIYTELLPNGLYRYTAGIYNNVDRLINDKRRVIDLGIKDAFVTAYLDGKRVPYNDAKAKKDADSSIIFEAENPIIFPDINSTNPATTTPVSAITPTFAPFKNNVTEKPVATPENGVKENDDGITFKVQIGAYSKPVPDDVANRFNAIKSWPIENKVINGLYIYNIGSYTEAKFAKELKEEAVAIGISDAFIVVYKDGVKLFGAAASEYLNK